MATYKQLEALPITVDALVDYLDEIYPDRTPDPRETDREIWMAVGRRQVIQHLLTLRDRPMEESQ